ncbi:AAA family ATPase [Lentisphaera marina]|uniref:polysaccharide biosynthesis tyrosine autokinase n=1 Tax=Lentisphaera marina TaxID=1111041 RepID=UPI002366829B|nr:AAA family ATPase [Lentisphaera marina]MDD7983527.1 AAA family ATPase [Lentisphaera marina]
MTENPENTDLSQEVNFFSYLLIVLRYWWVVGPATAIGAIGAYFIAQSLPSKYIATCRFEIIQNRVAQLGENVEDKAYRVKSPLDRHVVLLKSSKLNSLVTKKTLEQHNDIANIKLQSFAVNASPVRGAEQSMLDISVVSYKKEAAFDYINTLLKDYAKMRVEENKLTSAATREALTKEALSIDEEIVKQNKIILDFKTKNNYVFLSTKTEYDKLFVAELFEKANQRQFELELLQPKVDKLLEKGKDDNKNFAAVIDALLSNPNASSSGFLLTDISEWKNRQIVMGSLNAEYDILLKKFRSAHPTMKELKKRIDILATELSAYRQNILDTIVSRMETLKSEKDSYVKRAIEVENSFGNSGSLINELDNMNAKLAQLLELKNTIRAKLITMNENHDDKYITRIIREPFANPAPIFPNIPKMTVMGAIIFNLISAAIIIFLFMGKTKKYNFSKIIKDYDLPVLSVIPRYPSKEAKKNPFFLNDLPKNSVLAESFRSLRLNIEQKSPGKLILLTSFGPGEGKTSTSLNTALCCSWTDKKILIIDADFRRSTLRKSFPGVTHKGLLDYLKDASTPHIGDYIASNVNGSLDYLPAGHSEEYVTELIDGKRMEDLLIQLRTMYDLVIFDTAPAVRVVDTVHLAEKTDATVILARIGKTYPHDIETTIKRLPKNKLIGFVLNDFKQSDVKFSAHNKDSTQSYNYGYSYQSYNSKY